jgi:hypothetical protein
LHHDYQYLNYGISLVIHDQGSDKENMACVHNGVLFSHKNEIMLFAEKLLELEGIMLSKIIHKQKDRYYMFLSYRKI